MGQAKTKTDTSQGSTRKQLLKLLKGHDEGTSAVHSETLQLILVGPKGSGKSSAGNCILGRAAFKTGAGTRTCKTGACEIGDIYVTVVDTPGLAGQENSDQEVMRSITKACQDLKLPIIFLFVVPLGWEEKTSQDGQQVFRHMLDKVSLDHLMVLFTHKDQVKAEEHSIQQKEGPLQLIVNQFGGWFHVFNIMDSDRSQISELLEKVDRMKKKDQKIQTADEQDNNMKAKNPQKEDVDCRVEISHQKKRVQKRIEVIKNSEKIIAENKELLRELRDEVDAIEEELNATAAEDKKQALMKKIQAKAEDIKAKEGKIQLHIEVLQTLQQQVEEKQQHIDMMEKKMKDLEKEYVTNRPRMNDGMPEKEHDELTGTEKVMEMTADGLSSLRNNLQKLDDKIKSKREEEREMTKERNLEYKAQLQKIKEKMAT